MFKCAVFRVLFVLGLFLPTALLPAAGWACTCGTPVFNEFRVGEGIIPENAAGVLWYFVAPRPNYFSEPLENFVTVTQILESSSEIIPFSLTLPDNYTHYIIIRPDSWKEGAVYEINIDFGDIEVEGSFGETASARANTQVVINPKWVPPELELVIGSPQILRVNWDCDAEFQGVMRGLIINTPKDTWYDPEQLEFTTRVDGALWRYPSGCTLTEPGASLRGKGVDSVLAFCSSEINYSIQEGETVPFGLAPGRHTLTMEARLFGTDIADQTEPIRVDFSCVPPDDDDIPKSGTDEGCQTTNSAKHVGFWGFLVIGLLVVRSRRF